MASSPKNLTSSSVGLIKHDGFLNKFIFHDMSKVPILNYVLTSYNTIENTVIICQGEYDCQPEIFCN